MDANILGNRFQREYRYSRKSAPTWMPIFQEIGSNVDADIPGYQFRRGYRIPKIRNQLQRGRQYSRDIGSSVDIES
ncbi:unnamed protein product [Rhizophagus irregularis]|nr:unnamed protein product [Rhizophagus irregularis]